MNRFFRWGILLALLVMVVCGVIAMRMVFVPKEGVSVPSLVGLPSAEAQARLESNGLYAQVDQVTSDQPEGSVISQSVDPGKVVGKGSKIFIKVSRGGALVQVPDVRGTEFADAVGKLDAAGFKVGSVLRVSDSIRAPGTVIAQNPAFPANIPSNRMVDLLVSEGKEGRDSMVQVPDVQGLTEESARQILTQSELSVSGVISVVSDSVPRGCVVRTSPRVMARVPSGQAVTLYVAIDATETATRPDASPVVPVRPGEVVAQPERQPTEPGSDRRTTESGTPAPGAAPSEQGLYVPGSTQQAQQTQQTREPDKVESFSRKIAKVRYQVPPLTRSMGVRITLTDQEGTRSLKDSSVKGGEYLTFDAPYSGTASVEIRLDDEVVWKERYQ